LDQMFDGECAAWPVDFYPVAEVDTDDLEEAFTLTNSIDRPWRENSVRQVPAPRPFDQYLGPVGARAGLYRVASFGFEPFPVAGRVGPV